MQQLTQLCEKAVKSPLNKLTASVKKRYKNYNSMDLTGATINVHFSHNTTW